VASVRNEANSQAAGRPQASATKSGQPLRPHRVSSAERSQSPDLSRDDRVAGYSISGACQLPFVHLRDIIFSGPGFRNHSLPSEPTERDTMPLTSFNDLMAAAERGRYAVGYFESWSLESLLAVADAAEAVRSPAILGFSGTYLTDPSGW